MPTNNCLSILVRFFSFAFAIKCVRVCVRSRDIHKKLTNCESYIDRYYAFINTRAIVIAVDAHPLPQFISSEIPFKL